MSAHENPPTRRPDVNALISHRRTTVFRFSALFAMGLALSGCLQTRKLPEPLTPARARAEMQPPLEPAVADQLASELTLGNAIDQALNRNPGIRAARMRWGAAIQAEPQAVAPPDPTVSFGYQFRSVETRVGPQQFNLGFSQKVPWWEKLLLRSRVAGSRADIAQLRYEAAVRDLVIEVKQAYYELYYIDQASAITERIEAMLLNQAALAHEQLDGGRTQAREGFRAESQAGQLAYDRILLTEQRAAQAERIRSLLNLPPGTPIGPAGIMLLYTISDSAKPLYERAEQFSQLLQIRGLEAQYADFQTRLARLSRIPDVSVGLNFISTDRRRAAVEPEGNGRDPVIGLLGANLPIWEWRNRALVKQRALLEDAMRHDVLEEANEVRAGVAQAFFAARLTRRLAELYAETLLPQAEAVGRQAELDFRAETATFSNLIEATLAYHNFQLAYHRALADHGQAIGRLEQVIGTTAEPRIEVEEARAGDQP